METEIIHKREKPFEKREANQLIDKKSSRRSKRNLELNRNWNLQKKKVKERENDRERERE